MKRNILLQLLLFALLSLAGCDDSNVTGYIPEQGPEQINEEAPSEALAYFDQFAPPAPGEEYAVITTGHGVVELRLFPEFAPMAVENFITHAKNGYYDGHLFHRIIENFMIQTGDPTGTGFGGESIYKEGFYIEPSPSLRHFNGALCMARSQDPGSQRSQFYIVQNNKLDEYLLPELNYLKEHQDEEIEKGSGILIKEFFPARVINIYTERGGAPSLDFDNTVFGQVISGMDVVDAIAATPTIDADSGEKSKPVYDVFMNKVEIRIYGE